jgi:hypothetical protein
VTSGRNKIRLSADKELYQRGITSSIEGVETDINASKTDEHIAEVSGQDESH